MSTGSKRSGGPGSSDPRGMVTPDAFVVSDGLLGMPLASPGRRLGAILLDLMVIGVITAVTKSFALVLGVVASVMFIRAGFKRVAVPGSAFGRAMRASVGCLGIMVGFLTLALWAAFGIDLGGADDDPRVVNVGGPVVRPDLAAAILAATNGIAFTRADDLEGAREAGREIVILARDLGLPDEEIAGALEELVPADAPWTSEAPGLIEELLSGEAEAEAEGAEAPDGGPQEELPQQAAPEQPQVEAPAGGQAPPDPSQVLADEIESLAAELQAARDANAEASSSEGGLLSGMRGFLDDLGFGFGWASLYLTVMLSWWKGQTVGKRLLGIRVVRLDGEPITWWTAFERAGGYAAGFATGLLGFAQVYWDANRQAIHDRIVGTVVVREGAPKVTDWESAL